MSNKYACECDITFQNVYIAELSNILIVGSNIGLISGNRLINDRIIIGDEYCWSPIPAWMAAHKGNKALGKRIYCEKRVHCAINLVGRWPENWWHFTYEILPKMMYIIRSGQYKNIPILIDRTALSDKKQPKTAYVHDR